MTTHTPTPWKVELHNQTAPTIANQYETVAELTTLSDDGKQELANASFIVTACNAHEAMKAELENSQKLLLEFVGYLSSDHTKLLADQVKRNQTALALADGKGADPMTRKLLRTTKGFKVETSARGIRVTTLERGAFPKSRVLPMKEWTGYLKSLSDESFNGACVFDYGIGAFRN